MKVTVPIVHLNGTSKQELLDQRFLVLDSIHSLGDTLARAAPNGRDFYPDGPEYVEAANKQHDRRMGILKSLIEEFHEEIELIQQQGE